MINLLYVDDEPGLLEIGRLFLQKDSDINVDTAESAEIALESMKTMSYDAIVSDYQMPGMDGLAFLKAVRSSGDSIPFIIFTGKGREEVVIEALNQGADFYLQKGGERDHSLPNSCIRSDRRCGSGRMISHLPRVRSVSGRSFRMLPI
ncbi:response regulator [Methanocalculus sp.]|uniref:response regulator n=1 Tax=Methanocalculus sp. TaxID=2004547 RepID=UPI00272364F4|nr:response regulator [Methanocalculus sp.]MDO8841739.1 response regulator [Methanocalculus sp.]